MGPPLSDARSVALARTKIQMIAQDPYESLNPRMRIGEIVTEPLVINRLTGDDMRQRAVRALERAGLAPGTDFVDRLPHELSGGQRQRVVIAAALSVQPRLLIADEPVSMLDVSVRAGILNLLKRLAAEDGLGVLMITHDLSTVAAYSDRIAVMYLGRIVETGPTLEVIRRPAHPYTEALLSVVPGHDPDHVSTPILLAGETPDAAHIPSGCRFHPRCPKAFEDCPLTEPLLSPVGDGHSAACQLVSS
ncbi:MAG: hypothetical protein KatS3mg011_0572 [Acidimicrobiia bacterium]|nr:MAG: hypothetical protein KatS3mg011_0572 [Acidimicrobiia bacterium]